VARKKIRTKVAPKALIAGRQECVLMRASVRRFAELAHIENWHFCQ
jgi:hypothetical protein